MDNKIKQRFIAETAQKTGLPLETVERIASFQLQDLHKVMVNEPVRVVELSGFGKFMVTSVRLGRALRDLYRIKDKRLDELANGNLKEGSKGVKRAELANVNARIEMLNRKQMKIDFKGIIEGVKNSIFITEQVEMVAKDRTNICKGCSKNSDHQKKYYGYKSFRPDLHCTICGCDIHLKTRSLSSSCPIGKWEAQLTEQQEQELKSKIDGHVET